jgi:hypothetical protein
MRLRWSIAPIFLVPASFLWPALAHGQANAPPSQVEPLPPPAPLPSAQAPDQPPSSYPAPASPPSGMPSSAEPKSGVELTTLRLLLSKGEISQAEYDAALRDLNDSLGLRAGEVNTVVIGKWATSFYGFVEVDGIYDTTQSLNEVAGNTLIARANTYAGGNDRMQFTIRNSRFGFRLKAPEYNEIRASAQLEMDFFGGSVSSNSGLGTAPVPATNQQEGQVFNNSVLRVRHMNLRVETPVVDFLVGQYWTLFGWHAQYLMPTIEIQGVPAEIFSRQIQLQISKTVKTPDVTFEVAVAAQRPVQRDSALPVGQAGLRFALNKLTSPQTLNLTGTSIQPLSVAVTGDLRSVRVPGLSASPTAPTNDQVGEAIAVDAFIPVIPGGKDSKGNSLALDGEVSYGYGDGDMYTGLTGGSSITGAPLSAAAIPMGYNPRIDNGIAAYDAGGGLHMLAWTAFFVGAQYYLPGKGNWIISGNYGRIQADNLKGLANLATAGAITAYNQSTRHAEDWFDVNLYWDMTPAVRWGVEYANFHESYNDGQAAVNYRGQFTGCFLF